MKKVYYENGPDTIKVGPVTKQILMKRGEPVPFDDETADVLLKKPMFKEQKEEARSKKSDKSEK